MVSQRNTTSNYIEYLKNKGSVYRLNGSTENMSYTQCFNKAVELINVGGVDNLNEANSILTQLYSIRKDPDVKVLLNQLGLC